MKKGRKVYLLVPCKNNQSKHLLLMSHDHTLMKRLRLVRFSVGMDCSSGDNRLDYGILSVRKDRLVIGCFSACWWTRVRYFVRHARLKSTLILNGKIKWILPYTYKQRKSDNKIKSVLTFDLDDRKKLSLRLHGRRRGRRRSRLLHFGLRRRRFWRWRWRDLESMVRIKMINAFPLWNHAFWKEKIIRIWKD